MEIKIKVYKSEKFHFVAEDLFEVSTDISICYLQYQQDSQIYHQETSPLNIKTTTFL